MHEVGRADFLERDFARDRVDATVALLVAPVLCLSNGRVAKVCGASTQCEEARREVAAAGPPFGMAWTCAAGLDFQTAYPGAAAFAGQALAVAAKAALVVRVRRRAAAVILKVDVGRGGGGRGGGHDGLAGCGR